MVDCSVVVPEGLAEPARRTVTAILTGLRDVRPLPSCSLVEDDGACLWWSDRRLCCDVDAVGAVFIDCMTDTGCDELECDPVEAVRWLTQFLAASSPDCGSL